MSELGKGVVGLGREGRMALESARQEGAESGSVPDAGAVGPTQDQIASIIMKDTWVHETSAKIAASRILKLFNRSSGSVARRD